MKVKQIKMRTFNREMYQSLKSMPLVVINSRTGEDIFYVIPADRMEVSNNELRAKNVNK